MKIQLRIPAMPNRSSFALERWFYKMHIAGLLFHPDDKPEDIVNISSGNKTFTADECALLSRSLDVLFEAHGDLVYEVGLKYFHKAMNNQTECDEA